MNKLHYGDNDHINERINVVPPDDDEILHLIRDYNQGVCSEYGHEVMQRLLYHYENLVHYKYAHHGMLLEQGQWISVKDGLPAPIDQPLLSIIGNRKQKVLYYGNSLFNKACFWVFENNNHVIVDDVTHWMALPEPPNK